MKLNEIRKRKGLSQEMLAEQSGISLRTIQRIERSEVNPQPYTLRKLADTLEVDSIELVATTETKNHTAPLRYMILSSMLMIVPLLSNVLIPLAIWYYHRQNQQIKTLGAHFISLQIIWLIATIVLIVIGRNITLMITGSTTPGHFSPIASVYFLMICINAIVCIKIAMDLARDDPKCLSKVPRIL